MAQFTARLWSVFVLIGAGVGGCLGPTIIDEVATHDSALMGAEQETCTRASFQQYLECRALDCDVDPLVVTGYEALCDRDCADEAEVVYEDCAASAATATAFVGPTAAESREFVEHPDDVLRMRAGPIEEPCIHCAW